MHTYLKGFEDDANGLPEPVPAACYCPLCGRLDDHADEARAERSGEAVVQRLGELLLDSNLTTLGALLLRVARPAWSLERIGAELYARMPRSGGRGGKGFSKQSVQQNFQRLACTLPELAAFVQPKVGYGIRQRARQREDEDTVHNSSGSS